MNARDEILKRLHSQARLASLPPPWRSRREYVDLAEQFTTALTASKGEVRWADSLEEAAMQVAAVLEEINAQVAVVNNQPPLDGLDLAERWPGIAWRLAQKDDEDLQAVSAEADIGLSTADAALAETGTIVVSSGSGRSRLTNLLPPVHLALVPSSCLTADIFTWAAGRKGDMPAAITLISGPSKTSDIEQTLAIGVHGPKRFIAILYDDRPPVADPRSSSPDPNHPS